MTGDDIISAIDDALGTGSEGVIAQLLSTADEDLRRRAWDAFEPRLREDERAGKYPWPPAVTTELVLGAGPPVVLTMPWLGGMASRSLPTDRFHALLWTRPAGWRSGFVAGVLRHWSHEREIGLFGEMWTDQWTAIRRAVVAGVLTREPVDDYLYLMVRGLTFSGHIEQELEADPQLLLREIWELFDPRPLVHRALTGGDRYWDAYNTWRPALVRLTQRGSITPQVLREYALTASESEAIGAGGRRWFKGLVRMLDDPTALPEPPTHSPPPPGNRLQKWS